VDHCAESGLNPATGLGVKLRHETLDVQIKILESLAQRCGQRYLSVTSERLFEGCRFTFGMKSYAWVVWTKTVSYGLQAFMIAVRNIVGGCSVP